MVNSQKSRQQISCTRQTPPVQSPVLRSLACVREGIRFRRCPSRRSTQWEGHTAMNDPQEPQDNGSGLSRRQFLQGSGVAAAATALGTPMLPVVAAQPGGGAV